jgi:hypothetical protein
VFKNKSIILIFFLILALIATLTLIFRITVFYGKATTVNQSSVVLENSYLFASPLQAKADGQEQIRITVFLLDGRGLGVAGQPVTLQIPQTVTINNPINYTDDTGKITFDLSTPIAAQITIQAQTNGHTLPQKVKITFY